MPRKQSVPESFLDLTFPVKGMDLSSPYDRQRPGTTTSGINVRAFDPQTGRARGGQRAGLAKWSSAQLNSGTSLQDLSVITIPSAGGTVMSQTRSVNLLAVTAGKLYLVTSSAATLKDATFLDAAQPVVFADDNGGVLYYVDGASYKKYTASSGVAAAWTASAGSLPSSTSTARLIETWRGRTVLSGLLGDPQNWFMTRQGDATDLDYSPATTTEQQAVCGNNSPAGKVGDTVTGVVPYSDDLLIFGGDHTLWQMTGDPMAGGRIDLISDSIGMAWGRAWSKDPQGNLYFFANRGAVYAMTPGAQPVRISQQVDELLNAVNVATSLIRLAWDDADQGLHVYLTPLAAAAATTHYFWESRTNAWWQDSYASTNHDPKCVCLFDGDAAGDRALLLGSWDGYVRMVQYSATQDDGQAIASSVVLGPLVTKDLDEVLLKDLQAVLGTSSNPVTWQLYAGATAEGALAASAVASGTFPAGRSHNLPVRRSGWALYLKLSATSAWALEQVRARVAGQGKVRRRG